jgi:uncharacterized protein (DUF3820 family)
VALPETTPSTTRSTAPADQGPSAMWARPSSAWLCAGAVMLPLLVAVAALVSGERTLFFRDIFNLHLPAKVAQAVAWREGVLPLVDPFRAGGQPSLGNANTLPLYPDNLLYLVADELWALNAHFWLHLLLAPAAAYWLGRAFGLSRPAAWAVGGSYALSGVYLSQAGFYNLVPGATIAPALVAAALRTAVPTSPGERDAAGRTARPAVALGALWCLLLLGGDPMLAAQALGAAVLAVLMESGAGAPGSAGPRNALRAGARLLPALGAGTLLALPQLAGLLQILPFSYRGYIGFADESSLAASWDPRQFLEWLLPLAFGSPELGFWGQAFSGGDLPLYFSVHPGLLTLGLVLAAGRPRYRSAWWGWATVAGGIFLALGSWNPLVRLLVHLPGAGLLRFPAKFFLLVALGLALLAGIGLERALREGGRPLVRALGGVLLLTLVLLAALVQTPEAVEGWLVAAGDLSEHQSQSVRVRWTAGAVVQALLALALAVAALGLRRWPAVALTLLLGLHSGSQVLWLRPALLPTDETSAYRGRPPLFEHLGADETLVHGGFGSMFGTARSSGLPDRRLLWVQRRGFLELYPSAGVGLGLRYELNVSAEGLDSFLSNLTLRVMRRLDDAQRLRGLRALGVEALVLDRPLAEPLPAWVEHRAEVGSIGGRAFLYGLDGAPDLVVAGTVYRSPNVNATISWVIDSRFDPMTMAVVPGEGATREGPPGRVLQLTAWEPERIEAVVEAQGPSVLVLQRAYLPFFRAEIDGRPARLTVANLDRLALELPAGEHDVRIWADRRPLRWSLLGPAAGALWLVAVGSGWRWKLPGGAAPSRQPAADA